ncbi:FluG domain-containing protein [Xylaria bambusicola]|uniref:FluG domain-containing protein n=1 Tax=Xylaria bambusicola TaxID=326684 RepID=UPI00200859E1|nr:FluG domain-containing protein [Xylaria bambusicola]KAI0526175.1 FluG domain-containing protein [Xylaria bambusicola]
MSQAIAPSLIQITTARRVQENHTAFLERFAAREAQSRAAKQKSTLSVKQHASHRAQLSKVHFIKPKYSRETEINVSGIFKKWKSYCEDLRVGDWEATIKSLKRETTQDFFLYVCENSKISSRGSGEEYIRQFQQLYTTVTGQYMDRNDAKEVYKYYRCVLSPRFGHRPPNLDGKPVLNVDNLLVILTFNIAYDTSIFPGERHRIQLTGCYQLLCYTGARPAELVDGERKKPKDGSVEQLFGRKVVESPSPSSDDGEDNGEDRGPAPDKNSQLLESLLSQETLGRGRPKALCYEDIQMMVVRHPVTGRCIPAMAIKFVHHKGADNKPKPTIFYFSPTRKLIFCAVSTILSLALHDKAFDAPSLTNASAIFSKKPPRSQQCIPLRWKESMLKTPLFRRYRGTSLSGAEAMLYSKLRDDIGQQSLDSGHEKRWTPRFARRGAANAANGDAPDSVRDQMMRHDPQFVTFHRAYLNEIANFDLQNAFLEEEKESQLFRLFAHVSLTRDPRATADMVPEEVWANLAPDPEIVELEEERARLKQGHYRIEGHKEEEKIQKLTNEIRIKRAQRDRQVVKEYREHYFYHRPTWDIERQARGEEEEEYVEPAVNVPIPERAKLAKILCHQPDDLTEDAILQQRIEVIDLIVALCDKRETVKRDRIQHRAKACPPVKIEPVETRLGPDDFPLLMHAAQCPDCIGDERLSLEERAFTYCRPNVMNDHFDSQHLVRREQAEQSGDKIRCEHPKCRSLKFKHIDDFRGHVYKVHGVALRSSEQVKQRRLRKARRRQMITGKS